MSVWGKRDDEIVNSDIMSETKRKWGENSMSVWGKRDLSDKDQLGKSDSEQLVPEKTESELVDRLSEIGKQTKPESETETDRLPKLRILKRSIDFPDAYEGNTEDFRAKRNWSKWNSFYSGQYGGPKRNWETNTMKVWGKRSSANLMTEDTDDVYEGLAIPKNEVTMSMEENKITKHMNEIIELLEHLDSGRTRSKIISFLQTQHQG